MIDAPLELVSFLKTEYDRCEDQTLEDERETAIKRYNGEPYGDEEDGSSQVVARDTAETVDYMVISIMRTLLGGDRVVEFQHKDAEKAHEATETIMHMLMDEQDGYSMLHDWLKAGLLEKNAVSIAYPERRPKKRSVHEGVSTMALLAAQEQGMEIIEAEEAGATEEGPVFNITVMEEQPVKFCTSAVPNEEFYCSPDARTITEAALKGRKVRKTVSDLVSEGFPREEVETIKRATWVQSTLSNARDEDRYTQDAKSHFVWWHEEYVRFDLNDDGIAELLYVQRDEDFRIFALEEMADEEDHPFTDWCPFPMQHRRIGQSLADKVMDIERVQTVLMRQSLNGIYLANNPSTYVHEDSIGDSTIDDLLNVRAGRLVRWKGNVAPQERSGNFDPSAGFQMMEYMNRARETRTGITRLNMGLDEDTLNQTAKGQAQLIARGEQVEEYVARNFANGVAKLITKLARLLQRHGSPITVPIDGEYVEVDPRQWPEDMIARARIGLGASRKDQRLAYIREVIGMQAAAQQGGLAIVDEDKFFNSAKAFVKDAGLGDVTEYFIEPAKDEMGNPLPKPEKPDPEMAKAEADMQMQQAKLQTEQQMQAARLSGEQQLAAAKLEAEQQAAALKQDLARAQAEAEAQLARDRAEQEAVLAQQKLEMEMALAERRMQMEERLAAHKANLAQQSNDAKLSQNRPGGSLAE